MQADARKFRKLLRQVRPDREFLVVELIGFKHREDRLTEEEGWVSLSYDSAIAQIPWDRQPARVWREDGMYVESFGSAAAAPVRYDAVFYRVAEYDAGRAKVRIRGPLS